MRQEFEREAERIQKGYKTLSERHQGDLAKIRPAMSYIVQEKFGTGTTIEEVASLMKSGDSKKIEQLMLRKRRQRIEKMQMVDDFATMASVLSISSPSLDEKLSKEEDEQFEQSQPKTPPSTMGKVGAVLDKIFG
jgi:hypothetical protein